MHILQPATRTEARALTHVESFWVCSQRWAAWDENSKLSIDATLRLSRCGVDKARWASVWLNFYCSNKHTVKMVTVRCLLNNQSRVICLSFYTEIKSDSFFFFLCKEPVPHMFTVSYTFMIQERLLLYEESFIWQYCRNNSTASASVTVSFSYYVQGNADDYDLSQCSYNRLNYTYLDKDQTFPFRCELIDTSHLLWIWLFFFIKIYAIISWEINGHAKKNPKKFWISIFPDLIQKLMESVLGREPSSIQTSWKSIQ